MMDNKPLRILTVANVPPDPNSGAAGTVYHTNVALRELGHNVDEIWADDLGPRRIAHGNLHSLLEQPRAYRREVMKAVARKNYDVVMMSQPQAYLAAKALKANGFGGLVINRSHGVELRVDEVLPRWHVRLGVSESRIPALTAVLRRMLQRQWAQVADSSDGIIVPCDDDRDCLLERLTRNSGQVRTIHHGVCEAFLSAPAVEMTHRRSQRLVYVGQSAFIKGPVLLAKIVNAVLRARPKVTMTWITASSAHNWLQSLLDPEIVDRVSLLPWQSHDRLVELYDQHGLFVFPTLFEGAGKVTLEAMSRGLCVVASNHSAMKDYITDGVDGHLCSNGDVSQFVSTIHGLLDNAARIGTIGCRARQRAARFSWKVCAQHAVDFFEVLRQQQWDDAVTKASAEVIPLNRALS